jgi:hypothetical protein
LQNKSLVDLVKERVVPNRKEGKGGESILTHMILTFWLAAISNNGSFDAIAVVSVNEFGMKPNTFSKEMVGFDRSRWK